MHNFVYDMLHATPAALRIEALWKVWQFVFLVLTILIFSRNTKKGKPQKRGL
jgi:hypothetical protein